MHKQQKKLKQKYLCHIQGPILFTAPHSKKVYRGGSKFQQKKRVHLREMHTSYLAVDFANQISNYLPNDKQIGSFCIWGKSSVLSEQDLDPNYLMQNMYSQSPFHLSLHQFQAANQGLPLFHIDIHGKFDRQNNCQLDIGLQSMISLWPKDDLFKHIQQYMQSQYEVLFKGIKLGKFEPKPQNNPFLCGYWGSKVATMSTQAIELGIPSLQLQIPRKMRDFLSKNIQFRSGFLQVIGKTYKNVIVPRWQSKIFALSFNQKYLSRMNLLRYSKKQMEQLRKQLQSMQRSAQLNLILKII